jgi:hypothetical protein
MTSEFIAALSAQSDEIVDKIRPMLAGLSPPLQGIIVAELTAIWIAGHQPEVREGIIRMQDEAVRELVTIWHQRMWPAGSGP